MVILAGGESRLGAPFFSLQLVRESIKEEIDMTANAVTHQTLVCLCVCARAWLCSHVCAAWGGQTRRRNGRAKQQTGPLNVPRGTTGACFVSISNYR